MLHLKKLWSHLTGFVILILTVTPAFAQFDTSAPTAVCLVGNNPGIDDTDSETAAMLVCDELRKQGISVSDPVFEAPASVNVYRVSLRRLGEKIFVRLSQENPIGTVIAERQMTLANIEEMIPAAPRLVDALVHGKPIDATVDMETVAEQEARELRKITGESLWNVGIFGTTILRTDIVAEPGWQFGWTYQTPSYSIGTEGRFSGNEDEDDGFTFFSWSIGGRYFINKQNISPFAGGGLAIVNASYVTRETEEHKTHNPFRNDWDYEYHDYYDSEDDSGLGIYGVVGIELLRLTQSRLNLEMRVDRPFFILDSQDMMPITFGISFSRNYVPGSSCLF